MEASTQGDQSIREMADASGGGEEEGELFPLGTLVGDDLTLRQLIKPAHRVEVTVSMQSAEVPSPTGGLLNPEKEGMALVTYELAKLEPVPIREGDRHEGKTLVGWKLRQHVRPIHVESVRGEAGVVEAGFAALLDADPEQAGALLDRLKARTSKALGN